MRRAFATACLVALAATLGAPGCGDDEEPPQAQDGPGTTATETSPRTGTDTPTETDEGASPGVAPRGDGHGGGHERPEEQQGGAGDEEPARSLAMLTGRNGRITPILVRVPPFISIRVELRSADGRAYGLRFGRASVRAGGGVSSSSTRLDGLRPGAAYTGRPVGGGNRVRIEASAEPGP